MKPTDEQQAIIDVHNTGTNLVIEAGAGTGKTTTLKMLGTERPGRVGGQVPVTRPERRKRDRMSYAEVAAMMRQPSYRRPLPVPPPLHVMAKARRDDDRQDVDNTKEREPHA